MGKKLCSRFKAALCAFLCAALLFGCTQPEPGAGGGEAAQADPLTGTEAQYAGMRAAAIVIENSSETETQWGISTASVVLEALTESGRPTSLCLVYPSVEAMPRVGPAARGRDLYWRLLSGQQVLPVQCGGGTYDTNYLDYYNITAVDACVVGRNAFSCGEVWSNTPLWYTDGAAVSAVLAGLNISAELSPAGKTVRQTVNPDTGEEELSAPALLPFGTEDKLPEPTAQDAAEVRLTFGLADATGFEYDADAGVYTMLRADGTPQLDANNGEQAAFDNLLILYSASALRDDGKTLDYDLTVGGGVWLHGGQYWNITWQQGGDSTFAFYDEDGEALGITPGRSYIALISSLTGNELTVTNSAGVTLLPPAMG